MNAHKKGRPEGAGWPANSKPTLKVHWPSRQPDALGHMQPACKHVGGFVSKPQLTRVSEDVTCERCKGFVRTMELLSKRDAWRGK